MNWIRQYYEKFRKMNPENTGLKLGMIFLISAFLLFSGIRSFEFSMDLIISLAVFVFSMTCHEVAHGYVAYRFGDDTAKRAGRLSLNPIRHLDLTGMVLPILLLLSGSGFMVGWAKPVPVNFYRLRPNRLGIFCVAIAGITVNLIFSFLSLVAIRLISHKFSYDGVVMTVLIYMYLVNLVLALFNLIPVTPLDGGRIVYSLGNRSVRDFYSRIEKYGLIIVIFLVYTGIFSSFLMSALSFFLNLTGLNITGTFN